MQVLEHIHDPSTASELPNITLSLNQFNHSFSTRSLSSPSTLVNSVKMTISPFFIRASRTFNQHPVAPKLLLLAIISGGGVLAYAESQSDVSSSPTDFVQNEIKNKKVVVLGTGWAGTSFLKHVDASHYDVQVVSPRNYFAFTPWLPSVTCGTVEARSIEEPVRNIIKKRSGDSSLSFSFPWSICSLLMDKFVIVKPC